MRDPSDVMLQLSESLFKEEIKKVTPSRRCLVVAVGGNWRIEEGEVNHRSRRKDREAEKRSSKEIR